MESATSSSTVQANGPTTTVPKKVRHALRLEKGMALVWTVSHDKNVVVRARSPCPGGRAHVGTAREKKATK